MLAAIVVCGLGYAEGASLSRKLGGWQVICWALAISLPVAWWLSRLVSTPLRQLERDTAAIRQFRFDHVAATRSIVLEIDRLGNSINMMSTTIDHFLQMIGSLAEEKELDVLLNKVAAETRVTSGADAALLDLRRLSAAIEGKVEQS